jgi:hypothetical protein
MALVFFPVKAMGALPLGVIRTQREIGTIPQGKNRNHFLTLLWMPIEMK